MHGSELFAIGVKADDAVQPVQFGHVAGELMLLGVKPAEQAFEADIERDVADLVADFGESVPRRADQASRCCRWQHHAFVDGAEEMQRAVRLDALDPLARNRSRPRAPEPDETRKRTGPAWFQGSRPCAGMAGLPAPRSAP